MRISDTEIQKILVSPAQPATAPRPDNLKALGYDADEQRRQADEELVRNVTADVIAMPSREDVVAELKSRVEAGTYRPTAEEIVDAMVRRGIADRIV